MACVRCGGTGVIARFAHHEGGTCFRCRGSGRDPNELGPFGAKDLEKTTVIKGRRITLRAKTDLQGRFLGYSVAVDGKHQVSCKNHKEAAKTYRNLVQQEKVAARNCKD